MTDQIKQGEPEDGDQDEESGVDSASTSVSADAVLGAARVSAQMRDLKRSLASNQNLAASLSSVYRWQQSMEEATAPLREVEQSVEETTQSLRDLQESIRSVTQPYEELQQTVSAVQSVRGILKAYDQQWEAIRETLIDLRSGIREAVENQIRLEMPWEYDSVEPNTAAKVTAENWVENFVEELDQVDDEYFERLVSRVEDGLDEFREGPDRPYATIHIFISMQDALLWWLCYQDEDISTEATNDIGLPKFETNHKQDALRKYYQAYFGVEGEDTTRLSDYKWDCFWAHRHSIMHGDLYATYDMNIATTALLFFALTAHSVLKVIEERDEAGEDIPSVIDEIEASQVQPDPDDVDPAETLGAFMAISGIEED